MILFSLFVKLYSVFKTSHCFNVHLFDLGYVGFVNIYVSDLDVFIGNNFYDKNFTS